MRTVKVLEIPKCMCGNLKPTQNKIFLDARFEPIDISRENNRVICGSKVFQIILDCLLFQIGI